MIEDLSFLGYFINKKMNDKINKNKLHSN